MSRSGPKETWSLTLGLSQGWRGHAPGEVVILKNRWANYIWEVFIKELHKQVAFPGTLSEKCHQRVSIKPHETLQLSEWSYTHGHERRSNSSQIQIILKYIEPPISWQMHQPRSQNHSNFCFVLNTSFQKKLSSPEPGTFTSSAHPWHIPGRSSGAEATTTLTSRNKNGTNTLSPRCPGNHLWMAST